jgi:hypothetical protein
MAQVLQRKINNARSTVRTSIATRVGGLAVLVLSTLVIPDNCPPVSTLRLLSEMLVLADDQQQTGFSPAWKLHEVLS